MLLAQDSEPALISRIAPRRGASIPSFVSTYSTSCFSTLGMP
jgi:hypothetical protein